MTSSRKAVIIGAGALGLGFLGERLAEDYRLCFADVGVKDKLLRNLRERQAYTINICTPQDIIVKTVQGQFQAVNMDASAERETMYQCLTECDLVFTATSRKVLPVVVSRIAGALNESESPTWLLFGENGLGIAEEHGAAFSSQTTLVDTVMLRMCRMANIAEEPAFVPMWPNHDVALVVESYDYIPLDSSRCASAHFPSVFSLVSAPEFHCWEHVKLYLFNGVHAFLSYHGFLRAVEFFPDLPNDLLTRAHELICDEVVPAIVKTHPCARPDELERFGNELLTRFTNPYFNDRIERGIRGVAEKLSPNERLVGGCNFIRDAGLTPTEYASTIDAGREILAKQSDNMQKE